MMQLNPFGRFSVRTRKPQEPNLHWMILISEDLF